MTADLNFETLEANYRQYAENVFTIQRFEEGDADQPTKKALYVLIGSDTDNHLVVGFDIAGNGSTAEVSITAVVNGVHQLPSSTDMGATLFAAISLP